MNIKDFKNWIGTSTNFEDKTNSNSNFEHKTNYQLKEEHTERQQRQQYEIISQIHTKIQDSQMQRTT